MSRKHLAALIVLVAGTTATVPVTASAEAPTEQRDTAAGYAEIGDGDTLSLGANGSLSQAEGIFRYTTPAGGTALVDVVCANVVGNSAVVAGTVKRATGVLAGRTNLKLQVIDGGATLVDQIAVSSQQGIDCAVPPPQVFHPVVDGNIVVHDR